MRRVCSLFYVLCGVYSLLVCMFNSFAICRCVFFSPFVLFPSRTRFLPLPEMLHANFAHSNHLELMVRLFYAYFGHASQQPTNNWIFQVYHAFASIAHTLLSNHSAILIQKFNWNSGNCFKKIYKNIWPLPATLCRSCVLVCSHTTQCVDATTGTINYRILGRKWLIPLYKHH